MRWYAVLAIAFASLLGACNGDDAEDDVREAVAGFFEAISDNPPKAYTYLAQDCKDEISFIEFATGLSILEGFLGDAEINVKNIDIVDQDGDEIVADFDVVLISEGEEISLADDLQDDGLDQFVKEDGRWRFADCAGFGPPVDFRENAPSDPAGPTAAQRAEADDDPRLPGEFIDLVAIYGGPYGNRDGPHTAPHVRSSVDYAGEQGLPPAGGAHWGSGACSDDPDTSPPFCGPVPWGFYREAWDAESLLHSMEHSGVILWYNTTDEDIIADLLDFAQRNAGSYLVVSPYPEMEEETVAITSWSRRLIMPVDEYDRDRLQEFFVVHECRFDPEQFC